MQNRPCGALGTGDDGHDCGMYRVPLYCGRKLLHHRWLDHSDSTKVVDKKRGLLGLSPFLSGYRNRLIWLPDWNHDPHQLRSRITGFLRSSCSKANSRRPRNSRSSRCSRSWSRSSPCRLCKPRRHPGWSSVANTRCSPKELDTRYTQQLE